MEMIREMNGKAGRLERNLYRFFHGNVDLRTHGKVLCLIQETDELKIQLKELEMRYKMLSERKAKVDGEMIKLKEELDKLARRQVFLQRESRQFMKKGPTTNDEEEEGDMGDEMMGVDEFPGNVYPVWIHESLD